MVSALDWSPCHWNFTLGPLFSDPVNNLHPCASIKGSKVCPLVHNGQLMFHHQVCVLTSIHATNLSFTTTFLSSFSFLSGFKTMLKQIFAREKLFVSISYVLCLILTLYFAIFLQSTPLTVLAAVAQVIFLFLNIIAMVPGGASGIKFFGQMFKSSVSNTLPI